MGKKKSLSPKMKEVEDSDSDKSVTSDISEVHNDSKATEAAFDNASEEDWTKEDNLILFQKIRSLLPKNDTMLYKSRANAIDWKLAAFKDYTAEECKAHWTYVENHLRHYRILSEVLDDAVTWATMPWYNFNKGSKKSTRHPDHPKAPLTSYMIFLKAKRDKLLAKNPGLGMIELNKKVSELYRNLPESKKQKYADLAAVEKEKYCLNFEKFKSEHPDFVPVVPARSSAARQLPTAPTPRVLYCESRIPELETQDLTKAEARIQAKQEFKDLNDKKRIKWIQQSVLREKDYLEQMRKYREENPQAVAGTKKVVLLTKEEKELLERYNGKPTKPPKSGYHLYFKLESAKPENKGRDQKEVFAEIPLLWKALSDDEKQSFKDRCEEMNRKFHLDMSTYISSMSPEEKAEFSAGKKIEKPAAIPKDRKRKEPKAKLPVAKKSKKTVESDGSSSDEDGMKIADNSDDSRMSDIPSDADSEVFVDPKSIKKGTAGKAAAAKPTPKKGPVAKTPLKSPMPTNSKIASAKKGKQALVDPPKSSDESSESGSEAGATTKNAKGQKAAPTKTAAKKTPVAKAQLKIASPPPSSSVKKENSGKAAGKSSSSFTVEKFPNKDDKKTNAVKKVAKKEMGSSLPPWTSGQQLYKNEPPKPPKSVELLYAYTAQKSGKGVKLDDDTVETLWKGATKKQQKQTEAEYRDLMGKYTVEFEKFARSLKPEELKKLRDFRQKQLQTETDDTSSDENASESEDE